MKENPDLHIRSQNISDCLCVWVTIFVIFLDRSFSTSDQSYPLLLSHMVGPTVDPLMVGWSFSVGDQAQVQVFGKVAKSPEPLDLSDFSVQVYVG